MSSLYMKWLSIILIHVLIIFISNNTVGYNKKDNEIKDSSLLVNKNQIIKTKDVVSKKEIFSTQSQLKAVTSLADIELNMSELDLTLAKGKPNSVYKFNDNAVVFYYNSAPYYSNKVFPTPEEQEKEERYKRNAYSIQVWFQGKKGSRKVTRIILSKGLWSILGFKIGDLKKDVLNKLGKPSSISINKEGTMQTLNFSEFNVAFTFTKNIISSIAIDSYGEVKFSEEYSGEQEDDKQGK